MKPGKTKKTILYLVYFMITMVIFSSCAPVTPIQECATGQTFGFFGGLWHGFISPVSFIASLILDDVAIYAVNNNGGWYDFGFVLGAGILFGGGSQAGR